MSWFRSTFLLVMSPNNLVGILLLAKDLLVCKMHGIAPYCTGGINMKSVDMLAFGVALTLGLAVAQTPREMAIALGVASATLLRVCRILCKRRDGF